MSERRTERLGRAGGRGRRREYRGVGVGEGIGMGTGVDMEMGRQLGMGVGGAPDTSSRSMTCMIHHTLLEPRQ